MKLLLLAWIFLVLTSCGTTWPASCATTLDAISCRCTEVRFTIKRHPTKPAPAGRLVTTCDGQALPLQVDGASFDTERAP